VISSTKTSLFLGLLVLAVLALAGCSQVPPAMPTTSPLTLPTTQESPLASPANDPAAIPTPPEGFGMVTGVVLLEATGQPPREAVMFLGTFSVGDGDFPIVDVNRQTAPSAIPSPTTGRFVIADVSPGQYGLSYWTPDGSALVNDPADPQYSLILTIEAGKTIDVGTLRAPSF
jgi:hypothetical protein